MPRTIRSALAELAALALLALPMLAPLLAAAVPQTHDGLAHTYRSIILAWHLAHGDLYPRWASDLGYGYGLPLFNFYAPLFYYPTALLILLRVDPALSANLTAAASVLLAGWGLLKLGREWFGEAAGWAAAAALLYAPYFLLDLYWRAAFPEVFGLALLPWAMLFCFRLARDASRKSWLGTAVVTGLALLAHNIGAIWSPPYLAGALGAGWLFSAGVPPRERRRNAGLAAAALLLGLGLAAFLILPALVELPFIQSSRLTLPNFLDYHNNFLNLRELLAPPRPFDPTQVGQVYPRSLGLAQIGLAVLGALFVWRDARPARWLWLGVAGASLLAAAFTLPLSLPVWDALGPMKFIQFPWRWLGPASLTLALLAGYGAARISARLGKWAPVGLAGLLVILIAANLSWAFTTYNPRLTAGAGIEAVRQFERKSGLIGLSTQGEFLPIWVTQVPPPDSLAQQLMPDNLIDRVGPDSLPAGATLLSVDNRLTSTTARISAPAAGEMIFDWFYFPGWRATVNGQPAEIRAVGPAGRLGVSVPAGESVVVVAFGSTPVRVIGLAISLLALVVVGVVAVRLRPGPPVAAAAAQHAADRTTRQLLAAVAITGLVLAAWRIGLVDRGLTPWLQARLRDGAVRGAGAPLNIAFGDQLTLLAWDPPAPTPSGGTAEFRLYWQAQQPLTRDYSIATHLLDENGLLVAQSDSMHPGGTPTSVWAVDRYDIDDHQLGLPAGLPPGAYRLFAGVYLAGTGLELAPVGGTSLSGQMVEIGTLQVTRAAQKISPAALPIGHRLDAAFGDIRLIGLDVSALPVLPGDDLLVTSYWEAERAPDADYTARFEFTDAAGAHFSVDAPPASRAYPTSQWAAGEILRGLQVLRVPAGAAPGPMALTVSLIDATDSALAPAVMVGSVEVQPVARSFTEPAVPVAIRATLGGLIRLEGTSQLSSRAAPGQAVPITLFWHALELVPNHYSVFIHLLDASGELSAQIDSPPLAGARPTTGWLPGEYLADAYSLVLPTDLPPGTYRVQVGLYRPDTGERLPVAGAVDASILIGEITVSE